MYYFKKVLFLMVEFFIKKRWIDSIYLYNNTGNGPIGGSYICMALCIIKDLYSSIYSIQILGIINLKLRNSTFSFVYFIN